MISFPALVFYEFETDEIASPVFTRHIEGGSFAFKQRLALGCQQYSGLGTSGTLIFEDIEFDSTLNQSHVESKVTAVIVRLAASGSVVSNMRLFLHNDSALQAAPDQGLDPAFVQIATSGIWQPNPLLPSGQGERLSTTPPGTANVFRQDGTLAIFAEQDSDVSQFIYMNIVVPNGHPLGNFGACGSGLLTFALTFDFFQLDEL